MTPSNETPLRELIHRFLNIILTDRIVAVVVIYNWKQPVAIYKRSDASIYKKITLSFVNGSTMSVTGEVCVKDERNQLIDSALRRTTMVRRNSNYASKFITIEFGATRGLSKEHTFHTATCSVNRKHVAFEPCENDSILSSTSLVIKQIY